MNRFLTPLAPILAASIASAQRTPMTRTQALQTALDRGARLAAAQADTAVAAAQVIAARVRPNPSFSASYSKSVPNYHYNFDIPFDFPTIRQLRIRAAQTGLEAANLRYALARATILAGQRVLPKVLLRTGFRFAHPTLEQALQFELAPR